MFLIFWSICWWPETNQNMFQNRLLVACVSSIGPLARSDYHRTDRLGEQVLELIDMKHCHLELLRWEYHIRKCFGKLFSSSSSSSTIRILDRKRIRWVSQFIYQTFKFWRDRGATVFFIGWTKIWGMLHGRVKKHQWWRIWYSYYVKWWFPSESKFASFSSFVHISYPPPLCSLPHSHYLLLLSKGRKRGPENRTLSHNFNIISTLTFRLLLNKDVGTKY